MRELLDNVHYGQTINPQFFVGYVPLDIEEPYARIVSVTGLHREHMQGPSGSAQTRLQVDWWDTDAERLNLVTETARIKLSGLRGETSIQGEAFHIRRLHLDDDTIDGEPQNKGSGVPIYTCRQEWRLDYEEEI